MCIFAMLNMGIPICIQIHTLIKVRKIMYLPIEACPVYFTPINSFYSECKCMDVI